MFNELEVVELTHDIKESKLKEGDKGTIVEIYKGGEAFEVEFISPDGKTSVLFTLSSEDIRPIFNREAYISYGLDTPSTPIYLSRVTVSGTASNLAMNDLLKGIGDLNLEIRTEMSKDKVSTEEFNYSQMAV